MATLYFKDDKLLIHDNGLSIADTCCCDSGLPATLFASNADNRQIVRRDTPQPLWYTTNLLYNPPGAAWNAFTWGLAGSAKNTPTEYWLMRKESTGSQNYRAFRYAAGWTEHSNGLITIAGSFATGKHMLMPRMDVADKPAFAVRYATGGIHVQYWDGSSWQLDGAYNNSVVYQCIDYYGPGKWGCSVAGAGGGSYIQGISDGTAFQITATSVITQIAQSGINLTGTVQESTPIVQRGYTEFAISYSYYDTSWNFIRGIAVCRITSATTLTVSGPQIESVVALPAITWAGFVNGQYWGMGTAGLYNLSTFSLAHTIYVGGYTHTTHAENQYILITNSPQCDIYDTAAGSIVNKATYQNPLPCDYGWIDTPVNSKSLKLGSFSPAKRSSIEEVEEYIILAEKDTENAIIYLDLAENASFGINELHKMIRECRKAFSVEKIERIKEWIKQKKRT